MRKVVAVLLFAICAVPLLAQTAPVTGYCDLGGSKASVSGLASTNFQQGIIPGCTVTVYLHGTQNLATIYADDNNTPLSNPFTANVSGSPNSGAWIFWAATGAGYDVVGSGGVSPNTYPAPVTLTEVILGAGGASAVPGLPQYAVQFNYPTGTFAGSSNFVITTDLAGFLATDIRTKNFPVFDLRAQGLVGDGNVVSNCSGSSGQPTLICTGATFSSADVGKLAGVMGGGSGGFLNANIISASGNTVTLASNLLSNVSATVMFYGTDNYAAECAAMNCTSATVPNAIYTSQPGRTVLLPRGTYITSQPFYTRNGDQLNGAGYSATQVVLLNSTSGARSLWLGANASGGTGTGTLDTGGLENSVSNALWAQPEANNQVCIDTGLYSGFDIQNNWFECGSAINTQGNLGRIIGNTFDSSTDYGITGSCDPNTPGSCGYDSQNNSHSVEVANNTFFLLKQQAIQLDGVDGWDIHDNNIDYTKLIGISVASPVLGNTSHRINIHHNNFVTSAAENGGPGTYYSCTDNYHINFANNCENCKVDGNMFLRGHNYDVAATGVVNGLIISNNTFKDSCEAGVCTNTCSGQVSGSGNQNQSIDLETASANVVVSNNHMDGPGQYCGRFLTPVLLQGNTCHAPFTVRSPDSGGGFTANAGFDFPSGADAGTVAIGNGTDSTTSAAVTFWNGATGRTEANQSLWSTADVLNFTSASGVYSSLNERAVNQGSSTNSAFTMSANPATGAVQVTSFNCTGSPCPSGTGGSPGGSNTDVQYNNASAFGGNSSWTTDGSGNTTQTGTATAAQVTVNGTACIGGPSCSFYENLAYGNPWHPAGTGVTHMESASGTPYGYFDPNSPGSVGNVPFIASQYSDSGTTVNVMGFEAIPPLTYAVFTNQANTYAAGQLQTVNSNSSSAGFRDIGAATDPPCTGALIGSWWWNTTYLDWANCSGFADNASPTNQLVDRALTQANVDGSNQPQYHYTPAKLAAIEAGVAGSYAGIVHFGDSDTSGFGLGQLSWVFSEANQLEDPGSGFGFAGYGWVTSDAVGTGLLLNELPTGVTGNSSGSWTKCYCQDGACHNTHSGAANTCLGLDNVDMTTTTSGAYQQYTGLMTQAFCYFAVQSGGGHVEAVVDGTPIGSPTPTAGTSYGVVSIPTGAIAGPDAVHVLRCQTTDTGTNTFLGTNLFDTTQGKGVFEEKVAAASNTSLDFAGNPIEELTMAQIRTDIQGSNGFNTTKADIVDCSQMWGPNEFNQNIPPANMVAAMTTINTNCHTAFPYADLPWMSANDDGAPSFPFGANTLTMQQYDDAIRSAANGFRQPSFSALSRTYPQSLSANQGLYASDNIHLSAAGQRVIANAIDNEMTPSGRVNQTLLGGTTPFNRTDSQTASTYTIPSTGGPYGTGDFGCPGLQASALYKDGGIGNQTVSLPASTAVPPAPNCYFWFTNANTAVLTIQAGSGTTLVAASGCTTFNEGEGGFIWFESPATYRLACMKSPGGASPGGYGWTMVNQTTNLNPVLSSSFSVPGSGGQVGTWFYNSGITSPTITLPSSLSGITTGGCIRISNLSGSGTVTVATTLAIDGSTTSRTIAVNTPAMEICATASAFVSGSVNTNSILNVNKVVASGSAGLSAPSGSITGQTFSLTSRCAAAGSVAGPSLVACGAATGGIFSCDHAASGGTCVISTTGAAAGGVLIITSTAATEVGTLLSVTCDTAATQASTPLVTDVTTGTSFTIALGTIASGKAACYSYAIF